MGRQLREQVVELMRKYSGLQSGLLQRAGSPSPGVTVAVQTGI